VFENGFAFRRVIFVGFKQCIKPTQVPHGFRPPRGLDIIYVHSPSSKAAKKSSSCNLSIFSFGANSEGAEVVVATCEDSRLSNGELWPDIDKLDKMPCKDTSVVHACDAGKQTRHEGKKDLLTNVAGMSSI
jgi:hypothetical protein